MRSLLSRTFDGITLSDMLMLSLLLAIFAAANRWADMAAAGGWSGV